MRSLDVIVIRQLVSTVAGVDTFSMQDLQDKELEAFLARHPPFGGWRESWDGVPLEFRACISAELPPRAFVGSVRAIVLRDEEVLLVHSSVPILSVGGRCQSGETIEQTLFREVAEETAWKVAPIGVSGRRGEPY